MPARSETRPGLYRRISDYFRTGIWRTRLCDLHGLHRHGFRFFRTVFLAAREFLNDRCPQQAAALTFYSLLSVVPGVAIALAIAGGFGLEGKLVVFIHESFNWHGAVVELITNLARSLITSSRTGLITGIGSVFLFWSVVSVLGGIENAFNGIRGIRSPRNWVRRITHYLAIVFAGVILLIFSAGVAVLIESQLLIIGQSGIGGSLLATVTLRLLGLIAMTALFALLYLTMPNERVSVRSSVFGGLLAGVLYLVAQWVYIKFQVGVVQYGAVYGGLLAIPLFLAWVNMSWNIVLFGAELAFAYENAETFGFEPDYARLSETGRRLLGLRIMRLLVHSFAAAGPPLTAGEISHRLEIPHRLVRHLLRRLLDTNLAVAVVVPRGPLAYQPARSAEALTIQFVTDKLAEYGGTVMPPGSQEDAVTLAGALDEFNRAVERLPANVRLVDIAPRSRRPAGDAGDDGTEQREIPGARRQGQ